MRVTRRAGAALLLCRLVGGRGEATEEGLLWCHDLAELEAAGGDG